MRFLAICKENDEHVANYSVLDTETNTYYPMVSVSVAYEVCKLLNKKKKMIKYENRESST